MKLIITRHGETEENVRGVIQGHLPGKLTKLGKEQAKKLAQRLKNEKIDAIFSSDLARASDTAKEIAKFHQDVPIHFVEELRERNCGELQGKIKKKLPNWKKIKTDEEFLKRMNAEGMDDLLKRTKDFLEHISKNFNKKTILLVAHGGTNRAMLKHLLEKPIEDVWEKRPHQTSVTIFEFDKDKKPKLVLMNCIKHLN